MPMEELPINNDGGQGYGFILYQTELDSPPEEIIVHNVSDRAQVYKSFGVCTESKKYGKVLKPYTSFPDLKKVWKISFFLGTSVLFCFVCDCCVLFYFAYAV